MPDVTTDIIISELSKAVRDKFPLPPTVWVDAAAKLVLLVGEETDRLYSLQQTIAEQRVAIVDGGASVALAKLKVEATDEYREAMRQKAKVEMVYEFIRVAKLRARLAMDEFKSY